MTVKAADSERRMNGRGGWIFFALVGTAYLGTALFAPDTALTATKSLGRLLAGILPIVLLVFAFMFLTELLIDRRWILRRLGKAAGAGGWALAVLTGVLSMGPLYAWLPLLRDFRDKGMRPAFIATFLYGRSLKLPLLPLMLHYFGAPYTLLLSGCVIGCSLLVGILTEKLAGRS